MKQQTEEKITIKVSKETEVDVPEKEVVKEETKEMKN